MAATVQVKRWTGVAGSPTKTQVNSNTRVSTSDDPSPGNSNPVADPGSGTNYSFWESLRLYCSVAPLTLINNLTWFATGNLGAGTACVVGPADGGSYTQATGTVGTTGPQLTTTQYPGMYANPVAVATYTPSTPLSLRGSTGVVGDFGDFVVVQFVRSAGAVPGPQGPLTLTWLWDTL